MKLKSRDVIMNVSMPILRTANAIPKCYPKIDEPPLEFIAKELLSVPIFRC